MGKRYTGTWESVKQHQVPEWYEDCKFGIFIHWGPYSVPAYAPRTWELERFREMRNGSATIPMRNGITTPSMWGEALPMSIM